MFDDFKVANYSKALLSPELFGRHLSRLFTGDVVDGLTVTPGTGLQVVLAPGNAFIRFGSASVASARYVSLVNNFNLTISTPDASNPRIDLVVVYVDNAEELPDGVPSVANLDGKGVAKAKIVQGAPAATPNAPNDTAIQASVGAGNPYTVVAQVRVDQGVSVIAANKISDVRSMVKQSFMTPADKIDFPTLSASGATAGFIESQTFSFPSITVSANSWTSTGSSIPSKYLSGGWRIIACDMVNAAGLYSSFLASNGGIYLNSTRSSSVTTEFSVTYIFIKLDT